ncbi:gp53-like domain-containing protein [Endobacterium cereale]|uniref:gp53-like domain-containing protein n=1 Tax=Endobacterium cereale TaxID=2663029 RepID=UPI002B4706DC|nr:hypothetical protein [Endobacterium cereale]MEB2845939.1 hypothetical protein [Endobacterium cereale]
MATSYYSTGTISLTNGSAVVTGAGTAWQTNLITNGYLLVEAAEGNVLPILSVDSNTQITAEFEWQGATGSYSYALMRNPDQLQDNAENSKNLVALLNEIRNGLAFKYDASGLLADRALFDARPKGFAYLVVGGTTADLYVKRSNTSGDWAGPYAYGAGPIGPMGPAGFVNFRAVYDAGTAYVRNDGVYYNGSSWVALQPTTGNAPPNLPTTANAYWQLIAVKGQDGTGIGDMLKSVYDPQNKQADAFSIQNMSGVSAFARSVLDDTTGGDVWATIGAQQALGFSGYQKLPSGLIIQWGSAVVTTSGELATINFPLAFPNNAFAVVPNNGDGSVATASVLSVFGVPSKNSFIIRSSNYSGGLRVNYFAVGN